MSDRPLKRIEELFQAALDLPEHERPAFLDQQCGSDAGLRRRIEALLKQAATEESFAPPPLKINGVDEGPGAVIGRYKLLQVIGEGGFGVVYMAEQQQPVVRKVALKIIKLGMDTKEVIARFEAERQALAMMDHAHIARVLDGGTTEKGRPYFVMELVRGISITKYCDQNRLSMEQRLRLFLPVCRAVQHAHQKGVIHRDLKPSNVMVTLNDGEPVPKVIDFGVAKAINTRLTEKTLFTRYQQFVGTPAYMSPEQAEMSALDVDTRSDIYSLGVLLYEILTGTTPIDTDSLWQAGIAEMQRVIREVPPQKPSLRISTTGDANVAEQRRLDLAALSRNLRGDLDWIVMKTLEKDRNRRYETAGDLAADLERHLNSAPVFASPPSTYYRFRKFLSRHRTAALSVSLISLAIIGGLIGTSIAMLEASRQRDLAKNLAHNARAEARRAEAEAAKVRAVTDFLVETMSLTNPSIAMDPDLSVQTLLDRASLEIDQSFAGQVEAEARLRMTIGQAYSSLSEFAQSAHHLSRGIGLVMDNPEFDPMQLYTALWEMTEVAFRLQRDDAFAWAGKARQVGHDTIRQTRPRLAASLDEFHDAVEAAAHAFDEELIERATRLFPRCAKVVDEELPPGDPHSQIVDDTFMAAGYWLWYGPYEARAIPFFRKALQLRQREMAPGHPDILETVSMLVGIQTRAGRPEDALETIRESIVELRRVFPDDHFQLAFAESTMAESLVALCRFEEAESLLLKSHDVILANVEDESTWYAISSRHRILSLYREWQQPEKAEPYRKTLARINAQAKFLSPWSMLRLLFPPEREEVALALDCLHDVVGGIGYSLQQKASVEASLEPCAKRFLNAWKTELTEPEDPLAIVAARTLIGFLNPLPVMLDMQMQEALLSAAVATLRSSADLAPFEFACGLARLAEIAAANGDLGAARQYAGEAVRAVTNESADHWLLAASQARVGRVLLACRMHAEAESLLLAAHQVLRHQLGPDSADCRLTAKLLHQLYTDWQEPEQAARYKPVPAAAALGSAED